MKNKLFFLAIPIALVSFLSTKSIHVENSHKLDMNNIGSEPLYRLCDKKGYHYYTSSKESYHNYISAGWKPEGVIGYVFKQEVKGSLPVWVTRKTTDRYCDQGCADYLFTISKEEQLFAISNYGYSNDGWLAGEIPVFYMAPTQLPGTTPLYRILQTHLSPNGHFYTTDVNERNHILGDATNYRDEGIGGYVWTTQVSLPAQ